MSKANLRVWNDLPAGLFLKTMDAALARFRDIALFPDSIGFDRETGGFLAIHRQHSPSALDREIPVCLFLKKRGFRVLLELETAEKRSPDCRINEDLFEIKQITHPKSIDKSIVRQIRTSYFKASRVLIHVCLPANLKQLEGGLAEATGLYRSVRVIWLIKGNEFLIWDFVAKKLRRAAP